MPLVSDLIPSLLNGVSQQAPTVQDKSQGTVQENGYSDPVKGLKKRPGTQHVAKLSDTSFSSAFIHPIRRSGTETFVAVFTGSYTSSIGDLVKVYDAGDGTAKTVNARDASNSIITTGTLFDEIKTYLTDSSPSTAFSATTVADFTYLVNKNKTVTKDSTVTTARNPEAMVYIRGGDYATKYTIEIKQTGFNNDAYATVAELVTAPSDITSYDKGEANIATDGIAKALLDGTTFGNTTYSNTATAGEVAKTRIKLDEKFGANNVFTKLSATVSGSVIHIKCSDSTDFDIKVTDSRSNGFAKAFKDATQKFAELPGAGPENAKNTVIKITGDNSKFADDFYVKLTDEAKGIYEETVGTGIQNSLDASTLPLQIIKETDGTFSVKQAGWKSRGAGDDTSNPFPSFVGSTISDIFFHQNRLGVLSEESVIFTEAGEFLNWFRPTVLNLLDTDPIDVTVSTNRVSILKHALPFSESLLIFSDQTQFILNSAEFLSPLDISLNVTTEFEADLGTTPVGAGRYVFFASPGVHLVP